MSDTPFPEDPRCHFYLPLLEKAELLSTQGFNEAAIVTAQSACEICAEQVLAEWLERKRITYLADALHQFVSTYNLANSRVQELYQAVTGDAIQSNEFWQRYKELTRHRNLIVHKGATATAADASRHLQSARDITTHLLSVLAGAKPDKA